MEVTIVPEIQLSENDTLLVTLHPLDNDFPDGPQVSIHGIAWCLRMSRDKATDLYDKLRKELGFNHA